MTTELQRIRETLEDLIFVLMYALDNRKDDASYQKILRHYKKKMEEAYNE